MVQFSVLDSETFPLFVNYNNFFFSFLRMMDVVDRGHNFPILSHLRTDVLFPVGSAHFSGIFFLYTNASQSLSQLLFCTTNKYVKKHFVNDLFLSTI